MASKLEPYKGKKFEKKPEIKFGKIKRLETKRKKTAAERREAGIQKPRTYKKHYKETIA